MKKYVAAIAALGLASTLLTGCGSGTSQEPKADGYDLTVWVYSDMVQNEQGKLMDQWVDEFKTEHPEVKSITLVPKNDAELLSSLMAGVGLPDVFSASARDAKNYKRVIDLLDLSEVFADQEFSGGFYPEALDAVTVDDGVWAIPFISYIPVIFRNLTVLKEAGIDPAEGIPTYDRFLEQMAQVKKAGFDATHSWTEGGYFAPGAVMGSDAQNITVGVSDGKTTIKPEQLQRTFSTLSALEAQANSSLVYDADATMEAFKTNKLAYLLAGPWQEPGIQQSGVDYDFVLVPPYEKDGWTGGLQGWEFFYGFK
ncbi:MAG: ABC transporter substrate-binding protein, partial [Propionicimonas sp.]|nr:ABC transporter substrate-binding protein [Propionicimonas sp.]